MWSNSIAHLSGALFLFPYHCHHEFCCCDTEGKGFAFLSGFVSETLLLNDDGTTDSAAVEGAMGAVIFPL
jgi:hypothetical protein